MPYLMEKLPGKLPVEIGLLIVCKENGTSNVAGKNLHKRWRVKLHF